MPMSAVCVSAVSSRPRLWSSQTNIRAKEKNVPSLTTMNSTEEISVYRNSHDFYPSPTFSKRSTLGHSYDFPEKATKKEKKWSIGSLFRRKKKEESESSSEEEQKKGFLGRRRKKSDGKKRKPKTVGGFDHVVLPKSSLGYTIYNHHEDTGVLSDPSCGFSNYIGRTTLIPHNNVPQSQSTNTSFNNLNNLMASLGSVESGDSISKKKGKELVKARAAARRTTLGNNSSSDEDSSLRSNSSLKIRSDESLAKPHNDSVHSRRSRAARTERYLKRYSKDGENPHNYLRLSKSDADDSNKSPSRSPNFSVNTRPSRNSTISGLSTIPPGHGSHGKFRVSNSTSNPSYKPPVSMNDYNNSITKNDSPEVIKNLNDHRSMSCDANIHKAPSFEENVLHVQFPIFRSNNKGYRNLSLIDSSQVNSARQPPQPPPRDPNRTVIPHYFENGRPNTCYFDNNSVSMKSKSFHVPSNTSQSLQPKPNSFSYRSTSEVYLPNDSAHIQSSIRPASTTPEPKVNRFSSRRNERQTIDSFNYLTDKNPRSRKPIVIKNNKTEPRKDSPTQKALDFWKQIEENVNKSHTKSRPVSNSPQMFTSQAHVQTQVFLPEPPRNPSPFKPINPLVTDKVESPTNNSNLGQTSKDDVKRKSSNLEEALDELEAIYKSLRLGDENLLDRAEEREKESLIKNAKQGKNLAYESYGGNKGALSDSSFSYETFDQVDSHKRNKIVKKNKIPDTKQDDMYNRKFTKQKSATISDPQSVISKVSYLLSSPVHLAYDSESEKQKESKPGKEPDITFDDVVYRNVKHANANPKVVEPQPPFGIPLGPVAPATNSDYLHAVPGKTYTPEFIPKKIPDIVKDDLAFRNLRKDPNKEPVLPQVEETKSSVYPEERKLDLQYLKKRRAGRSLSANIGNILGKDLKENDGENAFKNKTLTDIADAMDIARKVLQEKGKNITNTSKAFMSDTDANPAFISGDSYKERRLNFLNGLKNPQTYSVKNMMNNRSVLNSSTKQSTPTPKPAVEENVSDSSSLDDLLNALAEEAKVTTDRITKELKELEEKRKKEAELKSITKQKIDDLKPCQKLLKAVVDSKEHIEYSKAPCETAEEIKIESSPAESANVIQSIFPPPRESSEEKKDESEHDYENIDSEEDQIDLKLIEQEAEKEHFKKCQSPFEERKAEIVATFQELNKDIDDIKVPTFAEKNKEKKTESIYDNLDGNTCQATTNGEEGEHKFDACLELETPSNTNPQVFTPNIENTLKNYETKHVSCDNAKLDSLESLKSPKLVMETSKIRHGNTAVPKSSNMVMELHKSDGDICKPSTSGMDCIRARDEDDKKLEEPWYHDPTKVAVACTYGIACAHQLASINLVAVFSLLFAVMSFIVALFF